MRFQRRDLLKSLSFVFGASFVSQRGKAATASGPTGQPIHIPSPAGSPARSDFIGDTEMEKVTGIGGFFFRAHDPKGLGRWYQDHLGVALIPTSYDQTAWRQEAGVTAFAPMAETSNYFGDPHKMWMLNFRVRDLDKMAAQLRAAGIEVKVDSQTYPNGRFAHLRDPEGNPLELWQPAGRSASD
jgi:glyoxylase I family protein